MWFLNAAMTSEIPSLVAPRILSAVPVEWLPLDWPLVAQQLYLIWLQNSYILEL